MSFGGKLASGFSSQGYVDYLNQSSERDYKKALTDQYIQALKDAKEQKLRDQQASGFAGRAWKEAQENALGGPPPGQLPPPPGAPPGMGPSSMQAFAPPQPGMMPQPPMPGQSSQPAQGMPPPRPPMGPPPPMQGGPGIPPPPGGGMPGAGPGGPSQAAPPAALSKSWQPPPQAGAGPAGASMQPQPGQSQLPPPPAAPPQAQPPPAPEPGKLMYQKISQSLIKQGVPDDQVPAVMAKLKPLMDQQFNEELKSAQMQAKLQKDISDFALKRMDEMRKDQQLEETKREHTESDADRRARVNQGQQRIDIHANDQARKAAGDGGFGGKNGELMAALAERGVSLPAGFRSKEQQKAMLSSLIKRNPDLDVDEIADKIKTGQIDLNAQKAEGRTAGVIAGKIAYAENEVQELAPLVLEASAKFPRDKFVPWNKLKQYSDTQLSDPDLKELHSYLTTMSNAYDMLAARGGTDKDKRAENHKLLDAAESPEALSRAVSVMIKEAQAAGRAAKKSITTGGRESAGETPQTNAKGWSLHTDKNGNKAYVSPDGKSFEEVK